MSICFSEKRLIYLLPYSQVEGIYYLLWFIKLSKEGNGMTKLNETYTLNDGTKIPKVAFGTWQMPAEKTRQSVLDAIEIGYRHIDTALVYGNEKEVGQAVRDSGVAREDLYVTSKLPGETKDAAGVKRDFEQTMKNLDIDYLDLYLIHAPFPWDEMSSTSGTVEKYDKANQEIWKAMEEIQKSGRVKSIGVSNFNVHDLQSLLSTATIKPVVDQVQYYIGYTEPKVSEFSKANDIMIEAYSPLATGGLINNPIVKEIADRYDASVAQLAIQFVVQNGALPLPKATQKAHILDNSKLDFVISNDYMAKLNKMSDSAPSTFHHARQE